MIYPESDYIVGITRKEIYYTYWIIHHLPSGENFYYHGVRFEYKQHVDIRDINQYHSSSNIVRNLYIKFPEQFEKRIDRIFETKEEAREREIYVHKRLNVSKSLKFYNLRNTSKNFHGKDSGYVTAIVNNKNVSIKKEQFELLKQLGLAVGCMKGTASVIDENGNRIRISLEEAKQRNLKGVTTGLVLMYNTKDNYTQYFNKTELKTIDKSIWVKYGDQFKQYKLVTDISDNPKLFNLNKNDLRVLSGEMIPYCRDMVTVWDESLQKYRNVHKSRANNYVSAAYRKENKDMVRVIDENFNEYTMKHSTLTDDYKPISCFKLKVKNEFRGIAGVSTTYLHKNTLPEEYINKTKCIVYDKVNDIGYISNNLDKRLLKFKTFEKRCTNDFRFNYIYFYNNNIVFTENKHDFELLCEMLGHLEWAIYIPQRTIVHANYLSKIRKYLNERLKSNQY